MGGGVAKIVQFVKARVLEKSMKRGNGIFEQALRVYIIESMIDLNKNSFSDSNFGYALVEKCIHQLQQYLLPLAYKHKKPLTFESANGVGP